ncbi:MAG: TolC family protein [Burkholderiales bacterium]|nr:TolC family protein [Burkholderiales bacterium]MDE2431986.1 TolC family protein [Burkholderiales bacterium]
MAFVLIQLAGCASYQAQPLPQTPTAQVALKHLTIDVSSLPRGPLRRHRFDPSDGLDEDEVAMLAVANNPDLRLARADLGVVHAQAYAADLLPDPQLNLTRDFAAPAVPGTVSAFSLAPSVDLAALIAHPAVQDAARSEARRANLTLLWQEEQTITQARLLFTRAIFQSRQVHLLDQTRAVLDARNQRAQAALARGDLTQDVYAPLRAALEDTEKQRNDLERQSNQMRHELNALLGLAPAINVPLIAGPASAPLNQPALDAALRDLPRRRADLLAFAAGYASQEARLHQAVLAQFPILNLGLSRARDTAGLYTSGFAVGFTLPLFNRNRGNIAIEQATRERMRIEYQNRLDQARSEIDRLEQDLTLAQAQSERLSTSLTGLEAVDAQASTALHGGLIDVLASSSVHLALLAKRAEWLSLQETIAEQRIALAALLGTDPELLQGQQ